MIDDGRNSTRGRGRREVLGRKTNEIDLFKNAEKQQLAIERLSLGDTIPQMKACIDLPEGGLE